MIVLTVQKGWLRRRRLRFKAWWHHAFLHRRTEDQRPGIGCFFFLIEIGRMFRKFRWQHMATIQGWNARKDVVDVVDVVVEQRFHAHFG